eukprot:Gb_18120 [translate_table: standard]
MVAAATLFPWLVEVKSSLIHTVATRRSSHNREVFYYKVTPSLH